MIAAVALAAVLDVSVTERDALAARWTHASVAPVPAGRRLRDARVRTPEPGYSLRDLAVRELSVPGRYRLATASPPPQRPPWWMPLWKWFVERWNAFWRAVLGGFRLSSNATSFIADVFLAALIAAVVIAASRLALSFADRGRRATTARRLQAPLDAETLYAQACQRAARGEYARAAQLLFAAFLAFLDAHGIVQRDTSATVGDVRRSLRRNDATVVSAFDEVAAAFVAGTYAETPIGAQEWARAREAYAGVAREAVT